jgi:hypothetical protein
MWTSVRAAVRGALVLGVAGCNAIFGIQAGTPGDPGSGGGGGACQPSKPAHCDAARLTDAEACCVAGRSCQGGTCAAGECQAVQLGSSPAGTEAIAVLVTGDSVVWSSGYGRSIFTTTVDGGARSVLVGDTDTDFEDVTMLALDADRRQLYFTDYGGARVGRVGLDAGKVEVFGQLPGAGAKAGLGRILVEGGYVYVAADYQVTAAGTSGVFRAPVTATALPVDFEKVADAEGAFGLAAAAGYLYFGDAATMSIQRIQVSAIGQGGAPETVVANQPSIGELAVDESRLYWPVGQTVWAHGLAPGGARTEVHTADSYVWGIVADEDYVYWTTVGDSAMVGAGLYRVDTALEGSVTKLVDAPAPQALATVVGTCDRLYLVERSQGKVLALAK